MFLGSIYPSSNEAGDIFVPVVFCGIIIIFIAFQDESPSLGKGFEKYSRKLI